VSRDRVELPASAFPPWDLAPHDIKMLQDCGIDPEVEVESVDTEYDRMFNHVAEVRRRRGEWVP
jgi:hypothetical protein